MQEEFSFLLVHGLSRHHFDLEHTMLHVVLLLKFVVPTTKVQLINKIRVRTSALFVGSFGTGLRVVLKRRTVNPKLTMLK